jgi:hypothetical protein
MASITFKHADEHPVMAPSGKLALMSMWDVCSSELYR